MKKPGKALYSCMLNEQGGVIDDLIIYLLEEDSYRIVSNAATRDKDMAWIGEQAKGFDVQVRERPELAIIAVQGPKAREAVIGLVAEGDREAVTALGKFSALDVASADGVPLFIARTGYTGEDGFEVVLPEDGAVAFWNALVEAGVKPAGLAARDTLRLEAGMNLYGQDMGEDVTPYVSCSAAHTGNNIPNYCDPALDDLLAAGRRALTPEAQQQAYYELQEYMAINLPYLYLWHPDIISVKRNTLQGMPEINAATAFQHSEQWYVVR